MRQSKLKIAITGGIGSGKTTVANIIKEQGYTVYSCDEIYAELLSDREFLNALALKFGEEVIVDGKLNRSKLSQIVFDDKEKLSELNAATHFAIMQRAVKLMDEKEISFCEVPLLFEGGFEKLFDSIIVVLRDKSERIKSVVSRSGLKEKEVINRINSQFDYDNTNFTQYYVIHNDGNLPDLKEITCKMIREIIE